ncbi:uncharacterized protein LOC112687677 isoform X2 [Sipha flava]|uniref:Uncharacterized protein LOC112687677 isoform X2 n=1 Tax=Sipha flava TaxID=143950 RepID=A0A8B8FZW0_9HEMI|nr:uncharacterized protein LOC112687677 isoform X2 [Sipha flava]
MFITYTYFLHLLQIMKSTSVLHRRGVIVYEEDIDNVFTIEDMKNLALEIKHRRKVTIKHLKVLKHALLNGQEFILSFYQIQGAVDSLLHFMSSKNEGVQLAAIECICNMALGDKKTCIKLTKIITPYLMIYINSWNFNLSCMSIWTLGNLCDSNEESCKLLQNQNFFCTLIESLKNSTCDEVILNTFYALKLFLKTYIYQLEIEELNKLLLVCFERLNFWKESFWIVYQISCRHDCDLLNANLIKQLFFSVQDEDIIDIKCLVAILRTIGNIVAKDNSSYSANEIIIGLKNSGPFIRNILIKNRQINLNDECAWVLGNVFNVLQITELHNNNYITAEDFNEICNYLFV